MSRWFVPPLYKGTFADRFKAYRLARAEMDVAYAREQPDEVCERIDEQHTIALDRLMLTPAETIVDLRRKLEVFDDEEIDQDWWSLRQIVALIAVDARHLLPLMVEEDEA